MNKFYVEGNVVPFPKLTDCKVVDISDRKAVPSIPKSNFTSQGKRKCAPCDPIRSLEHIELVKNYFLTQGKKSLRLRNYMIFVLGVSVGLRGCDLLRLKIKDVLHVNGYIVDELRVYESKTHKMNYPMINDVAKEAIVNYLNSLDEYSVDDYLIRSQGKADMDENTLYNLLKKAQIDLNLPYNIGAHSLRKTFSYWTIAMHPNDTNVLASLQEMLNHSEMKTTLHYSGHTKEHLHTLYNDIGKVFTGGAVNEVQAAASDKNAVESKLDTILNLLCGEN